VTKFTIQIPVKTKREYIFSFYSRKVLIRNFGFKTTNFDIPHGSIWDTLYPMMFITRNGGPVFNKLDEATLVFEYPVVKEVVDLMIDRCKMQGINLTVDAPSEIMATAQEPLWDCVVGFGGGKESSLNCGITRELGYSPMMMMGSRRQSVPKRRWNWDDIVFTNPINKGISDRLVAQLMCGRVLYHGSCLDDSMKTNPWHQYYDIGCQESWNTMNDMFKSVGVDRSVYTPLECLPCAQIPKILCTRYPDVAEKRKSVDDFSFGEKNMHVSLCEMTGGIDPAFHCKPDMLVDLVNRFIDKYNSEDYGKRDARLLARDGMCAMLYYLRDHKYLKPVKDRIKDEWEREFIHKGHFYKDVPKEFESIIREYIEESPDGTNCEGGIWVG
jgi:hypothetical protein